MSTKYAVYIHPLTERHHTKRFRKKYKKGWDITLTALQKEFEFLTFFLKEVPQKSLLKRKVSKYAKRNSALRKQSNQRVDQVTGV